MREQNNSWEKQIIRYMVGLLVFFLLLIVLLAMLGISEWASIICAFMSVVTAVVLGTVSVIQNKKAGEVNERLARINQDQFEASIINNNYPMIKFCDLQRIEDDGGGGKKFVFKFFDTRSIPLKEAYTRGVGFVPLAGMYKEEEGTRRVVMREKEKEDALQFTYLHEGVAGGFYMITVPLKELMFDGYRYCRVEIEMDLVSTTGVVTRCKGYALLDSESNHKGMAGREYPHVYHQFFEIKEIMSEKKYGKETHVKEH